MHWQITTIHSQTTHPIPAKAKNHISLKSVFKTKNRQENFLSCLFFHLLILFYIAAAALEIADFLIWCTFKQNIAFLF